MEALCGAWGFGNTTRGRGLDIGRRSAQPESVYRRCHGNTGQDTVKSWHFASWRKRMGIEPFAILTP